jgi:hypothetical protein
MKLKGYELVQLHIYFPNMPSWRVLGQRTFVLKFSFNKFESSSRDNGCGIANFYHHTRQAIYFED